jgi:hypothetical protein
MAIIISPVNDKRFSVNNIQYLKNYVTAVNGNRVEIFNCYERSDVLVPLTHYSAFRVEGVAYPNALALQAALLPLLYSRSNLGGDSPDIDQDNLDVVRYVRSASANPESILASINTLETYTLDAKQSLWFVVSVPGVPGLNGRLTNPNIYKYKMVNYGKGTYGRDAFQLAVADIEMLHTSTATAADIALQPGTQTYDFGILNNITIRNWLISQNPAITLQPQNVGYTLFKGTVNGSATTYLWVGANGTAPAQTDFLALGGTTVVTEQDNVDIKKTFTLPGRLYTINTILGLVNNLPAYTVNERQSVWFVGSERVTFVIEDIPDPLSIRGRFALTNPLIVKYKMLNKGKGIYGAGQTQLTASDLELVYNNEATINDLESVTSTQIIPFTLTVGQTVSQWVNSRSATLNIQPQENGYTIFKSTVATEALSYLWIGEGGIYGNGAMQSSAEDFQLLNETVLPVNQDNIDVKKSFTIPNNYTSASILAAINGLSTYEVTETQSVWFTGRQRSALLITNTTDVDSLAPIRVTGNPLILKYKMLNKGKGRYGQGGIVLTLADIELIYTNEATLEDLESVAETRIIPFTLAEGQTISAALNSTGLTVPIQPQEEGYTIFRVTRGGEELSYLWIGAPGNYGNNGLRSSEADFQQLNDVAPAPFMSSYAQVLSQNSVTTQYAIHVNEDTDAKTAYGPDIIHEAISGKTSTLHFEEPVASISYSIPAKVANDVFAMRSDIHKPVKVITIGSVGFENGTYTLNADDKDKWLLFTIGTDFMIKIPEGTFTANTLIEGETADTGQATFVTSGNLVLHHGTSELPKTAEMNSVFGLKFRSETEVSLFGKLELV